MERDAVNREAVHRPARDIAAVLLVVVIAIVIAAYRVHHDARRWDPDAAIYLRMTLEHRGLTQDAARAAAEQLIRESTPQLDPRLRSYLGGHPPQFYVDQFALFHGRQLYPTLAALIYPRYGPLGLRLISAFAYICAVLAMYLLLRTFTGVPIAAVGAVALGTAPAVLDSVALVTTDQLGNLFWICALGALIAYVRKGTVTPLIGLIVAALALSLTRPAIYLPLGAAIGAFIVGRNTPMRRASTVALVAVSLVTVFYLLYSVLVHAAGPVAQLRWEYEWYQAIRAPFTGHGFLAWWLPTIAFAGVLESLLDIYKNGALLIIAFALFGAISIWGTIEMAAILGGSISVLVALVANPADVERTVTLPITPLAVILATVALQRLADARSTPRERRLLA